MECPICFELDGVPKVLPCQHTICQGCISSLKRINTVTCPICRKQTGIPPAGPGDLPTNLTIVQLKDMMDTVQKQGKRKACECCGEPGQTVSHVCKECDEQLCDKCAREHPSKKLFTNHKPALIAAVECNKHNKPFNFFCLDCNKLLCFICYTRSICNKHKVEKVGDLKAQNEATMKEIIQKIARNIEANKREIQPAKLTLMAELECVIHMKQEIKKQGKKLKDHIDVQVKTLLQEVDKHEHCLHAIKEQVESADQLVTLCKLKQTAEAACNGSIEHTLLTLPTIQAALPPNPKPVNQKIFNQLVFSPQNSINVGGLHKIVSTDTLHTTNIKSIKLWEKANVGKCVCDVVYLRKGIIAFTDMDNNYIIVINKRKQVLADSRQKGVRLQGPRCIAYHPTQDCLLVCDCEAEHVTFLNPTTLSEIEKVKMSGISRPVGVCVMSDGNIVVSGAGGLYNPNLVGVFDISGTQLHLWDSYNNGAGRFVDVGYVAVGDEDNILLSQRQNKKIIKLDKTGGFLCEWSTQGNPVGLTVAGDIVLVAEEGPDCVMAYNLQGGDARQVLTWDRGQEDQFGSIMSLSTHNDDLSVVGERVLQMYKLATK